MDLGERFLTLGEVADTLKVDPRVVRGLIASGELRGIRVGNRGQWRIETTEFQDYIDRQYQRATEQRDAETIEDRTPLSEPE